MDRLRSIRPVACVGVAVMMAALVVVCPAGAWAESASGTVAVGREASPDTRAPHASPAEGASKGPAPENTAPSPQGSAGEVSAALPVPVTINDPVMLFVPGRVERASVTDTKIASVKVVPPNQLVVSGKRAGTTTVVAWTGHERRSFDIVVQGGVKKSESSGAPARTAPLGKSKPMAAASGPPVPVTAAPPTARAVSDPRGIGTDARPVPVTMGASVVLQLPGRLERASVTNADIANIQVVPPNEILVNAKTPGITTVIAWTNGERRYFDVVVSANVEMLQRAMRQLSPRDEIKVEAAQSSVVLTGTVSDAGLVVKAAEVARAFLPEKASVVNLLRLSEPHQIMLKVDVAEVNRSGLRELGVDFIHLGTSLAVAFFGGTTAGILNSVLDRDGSATFDSRTAAVVRHGDNRVFLRALEQKGLVKFLARPTLTAASGASANFLAGGEFPVPVVTGGGVAGTTAVTIIYKPFGVRLDFTPTLNDLDSINLKITPEVSDLDFDNAVTLSGFRIPALRTRRTSTIVDLKPGQGLAVGGLISSQDRKTLSKLPILGDIPILGALFRSTQFIRNETDLVVFVTPEIVKPLTEIPDLGPSMRLTPDEDRELRQIPGK